MIRCLILAALLVLATSFSAQAWLAQVPASGGGGGGTYSFIAAQSGTSGDTNNATSAAFDSSGCANCLIVAVWSAYQVGTVPTGVIDDKGNPYSCLTVSNTNTSNSEAICISRATTVGAGHTVSTVGGNGDFPSIAVAAFSGSVASPTDVQAVANSSGIAGVFISPGVTPSVVNELLVTGISFNASSTAPTIDSGFTVPANVFQNFVSGTGEGVSLAYLIQTSIVSETPTWTTSTSVPGNNQLAASIATFKP